MLEALRNSSDKTKAQAIDWLIDEGFLHSEELYNAAYVLALGDALGISVDEDEWEAEDRDEDERMTRAEAEALANKTIKLLEPYGDFVEVCGSYRRGREDPGDLDIVIILKEGESLPDIVDKLSGEYTAVNWLGEKKTQIIVDGVKVDIRVSTPEGLGAALLYFTGPSGYNIGLRRSAKKRGMKLNEYGIWDRDTNEYLGGATEEEVYKLLDKNWKSPELRRAEETQGMPDHEIGEGINWMPYEDRTSVLKRRRAETFESETNWYSRYGMEIKGFSEPPYTKMGYVVRHPEPSSKMIGDLYEIRPRLIRRYTSSEGLTEVEGYEIPWWYWVDEDSEPISSGKFFNTLDEALRWLKDNPDLQPSVEWEQGHAAETFNAYDPADAWDNFMHQQEMALEAYQEYLDYSGEDPLMTFEEWMEWQADLEDEYLQQQWEEMQEEDEPSPEDDPEYTTLEGTLDSETFESPVSCKICGKTFASFRGLNGHMNAHIPTHRKRAEECEHEWKMMELPLERGHKYDVGWVNAAGIPSYHMVCIKCNYCTDCSGTHGFLAETFEAPKKTKQEIITYMLSNCEDWDEYSYRYTVNDEQWTLADYRSRGHR